ncbi:MAG: glutathione S-transferase family protein, partial [Mesorhizobium sp.]
MSLTLHFHPLASFCWKPLIAFYENDTPFTPVIVDLAEEQSRAAFLKVSPTGKMPALRDDARDRMVLESTIVVEYLAAHYPGPVELIPAAIDLAIEVRQADRFYDFYVQQP